MARDKVRLYYILSLLVLASLLIIFAQNVFSGLSITSAQPLAEINRVDLFDKFLGNYSKISVMLVNNDTVNHNFSINTFYDEKLQACFNVTVYSGKTFQYQRDVLPERIPISENETINSTLRIAKFVVYMDDKQKPFEEANFAFKHK
ncbi:hypothetical protein [uncultured Methanomethylovorans sp.]|uniref:hypothetical protein n=1 Tax=uncultured Methanomethylovorans sp. TaxID=183759 RepID=UPI002AA73735|nr:hypothetical protein [uncultured Methanomethylovorans sp.]